MEQYWFFILLILGAIAVIACFQIAAAKRRKELEEVAHRLGLQFSPFPHDCHDRHRNFTPFGQGHSRTSTNLIHGRRGEIECEIFDYKYTTGSGKNKKTYRFSIAAATVPIWFRRLTMRPEGLFDRVAAMVGYDDINFESEQFSRRYHVSCDVRKFAYDLIHPQMIEFLLACPARHWQLGGNVILIHKSGRFSGWDIENVIQMVEGFVERIPAYVREDSQLHSLPQAPPQWTV